MKVALVCIAKNEEKYIKEWCEYNLKLGFDDIFIYQNDWRINIQNKHVHRFELDGIEKQIYAYNNFIKNYYNSYDWAAFFDIDEFLVLKKHNNVKDFILDYNDFSAIGINWVLFGDNNMDDVINDYSVIRRFTKRQKNVNKHVKSIVKLNNNLVMNIHNANCYWVDTNKNINSGPFTQNPCDDIAQINHYFCKTKKEFIEKCNRGRADYRHRRTYDEFDSHNFNEIEDYYAYNFFFDVK
jgi:hypothetical protein